MSTEQLRVGDAERDEVTTALHEHFAQGRLTREELDERLTATLSARTVGDLRSVTYDLPGTLTATVSPAPAPGVWPGHGRREAVWAARGGWGPPRGRPFGPLLLVALIVAAITGGWWVVFPLMASLWLLAAVTRIRHVRRRQAIVRR